MVERRHDYIYKFIMANYIGLAYQFFNLTRESISEMEKQGNKSMIFSNPIDDEELAWLQYEDKTRWNDFNVGVPILYNFYHGLELYMKGLIYSDDSAGRSTNHRLTELFEKLKAPAYSIPIRILDILERNLTERSPFHEFFERNGGNVDNYYEFLRYPESKRNIHFNFSMIRGTEEIGLYKFKEIRSDVVSLKEEIVTWNKSKHSA